MSRDVNKTSFLGWLFVWLLSQVVSLLAITFLFALGLILIEFLLYPLALGIGALLVGLTAVWAGNRLVKDGLQTPAAPVVRCCEAAAVILSLILIAASIFDSLPTPPIVVSSAAATILAFVATYSVRVRRQPKVSDRNQTRRIVIWLLLALLSIPVVILFASFFGWAGA